MAAARTVAAYGASAVPSTILIFTAVARPNAANSISALIVVIAAATLIWFAMVFRHGKQTGVYPKWARLRFINVNVPDLAALEPAGSDLASELAQLDLFAPFADDRESA